MTVKTLGTKRPYERFDQFLDNDIAVTDYEGHTDFISCEDLWKCYNRLAEEVCALRRTAKQQHKMLNHCFAVIDKLIQERKQYCQEAE